jgi:hypothetical protein
MRKIILLTFCLLLTACSAAGSGASSAGNQLPAGDELPSAPPPAVSTPPKTLEVFNELDLQSLSSQPGDLPEDYQGGQVLDELPKLFAEVPPAGRGFYRLIERDGAGAGGVAILLYPDSQQADRAYQLLFQGMGTEDSEVVDGVGERAQLYVFYQAGVSFRFVDLLFERCGAVVHIRLGETFNKEPVVSYAQKLDKRLSDAICP